MRRGLQGDKSRMLLDRARREIERGERRETVAGAHIAPGDMASAAVEPIHDEDGNLYWMWDVSAFDGGDVFE